MNKLKELIKNKLYASFILRDAVLRQVLLQLADQQEEIMKRGNIHESRITSIEIKQEMDKVVE